MEQNRILLDKYKRSTLVVDKVCIFLMAICPILQHYIGFFVNAAVSVFLLIFPYVVYKFVMKRDIRIDRLKIVLPLIATFLFEVVDHGTSITEAGQAAVFIVYAAAIAVGCFNTKLFIRIMIYISLAASCVIIVQYFCFYILKFHLQVVPTSLLLERSEQWVGLAQTGMISVTGRPTSFYRPSAFFLEPSHMFTYMFPALCVLLLNPRYGKIERRYAMLITLGMVLCTSGMGIMAAFGVWMLHLGKSGNINNRFSLRTFFQPRAIPILIVIGAALIVLIRFVPFLNSSIVRIFASSSTVRNAILGRVGGGASVFKRLTGIRLLIGVSDHFANELSGYMTSFYTSMYKYGIIGTAIAYLFYLQAALRLKNEYFWISIICIVLSFFSSHPFSTFFKLCMVMIFMEGYIQKEQQLLLKKYKSSQTSRQTQSDAQERQMEGMS